MGPPQGAAARLRAYWREAASPGGEASPLFCRAGQLASALGTRLLGRPAIFHPRLPGLGSGPGLYDPAPLRRTLLRLVDFGRLNAGPMRVSVKAVDLESGAELVFDSTRTALTVDHIMGSAPLIPDFPPVRVEGRLLVDGSLADNLPLDIVLAERPPADTLVYAVDPFPRAVPAPSDLLDMAERQNDLVFASQCARTLRAAAEADRLRRRLRMLLPRRRATPTRMPGRLGWRSGGSPMGTPTRRR